MKCQFCGSEWENKVQVSQCPFCGKTLLNESVVTISTVIQKLVFENGLEVLKDGRLLYSYISDYVKDTERDKRLFKTASSIGILDDVYEIASSSSIEEQKSLKLKAVKKMEDEAFFSNENAEYIIDMLLKGCEINLLDNKHNPLDQVPETNSDFWNVKFESYDELYHEAEAGNSVAQFLMGVCYKQGIIVKKSKNDAELWLSLSDLVISKYTLACVWFYDRNVSDDESIKAAQLFKTASDNGHIWAQNCYSICLMHGRGVQKNTDQGLELLQLSSKSQNGNKYCSIYQEYEKVANLVVQIPELFEFIDNLKNKYRRDLNNGVLSSIWTMAQFYQKGEYVPQDYIKAFHNFKYCAETGDSMSQFELAFCYENGLGVDKDLSEAEKWYETAEKSNKYLNRDSFKSMFKEN